MLQIHSLSILLRFKFRVWLFSWFSNLLGIKYRKHEYKVFDVSNVPLILNDFLSQIFKINFTSFNACFFTTNKKSYSDGLCLAKRDLSKKTLQRERWLWEVSSGLKLIELLVLRVGYTTSEWGLVWERCPVGSRFSNSIFRDLPETVPESVCTCGFKRNSSNLHSGPRSRDSVLLNSWDRFSLTLPSITSESYVIYYSVIPGADVFCDWMFLVLFCVSLGTAANFRLFLSVAILLNGKSCTIVKTEKIFFFSNEFWVQQM